MPEDITVQPIEEQITNGDMIRAMCDQELAEYMTNLQLVTVRDVTKADPQKLMDLRDAVYEKYMAFLKEPFTGK